MAQETVHVTPPRVLTKTNPIYSEEAGRARLEGTVPIRMIVGPEGNPTQMTIVRPLGLGLDEAAVRAVSLWKFEPGTRSGEPVAVIATVEVNFRLLANASSPVQGHMTGVKFDLPDGASRPILKSAKFPGADEPTAAPVTLSFEIDQAGAVNSVRSNAAAGSKWERDMAHAVGKWTFTPAMKDGAPIRVSAECTFVLP